MCIYLYNLSPCALNILLNITMQVSNLYLNVIYRDSLKSEGKYFALYIMKRHLEAMSVVNVVS